MKIRFFFVVFAFIILYGALGANLYRLQIIKSDYYGSRAEALNEAQEKISLRRGDIFFTDRFGNDISVAVNKDYPAVYAVPKEIKDIETVSELLAPILAVKKESLERSLDNRELLFRLLVERASPETISAVEELRLPGIYTTKKQRRFYPFGELASQVIGFVGLNEEHSVPTGLYGAEKKFEADLKKGKDIHFSIDRNIQTQAEASLKNLIETYKASAGTVIIGDPNTGKILAFANAPAFNPNTYSEYPVGSFINPGIQNVYEPGSVFKPLTMVAGIESGKITPETTFFDSGSITLNGKKITNWDGKSHGKVTMTNVIEQSINTGAVFVVRKIGREPFLEFLKKIGFGEKTGIDMPDEALGSLKNLERKSAEEVDVATAAFGQGTAVTPIQLISAFSAIANGGALIKPSLNAEIKKILNNLTAGKPALENISPPQPAPEKREEPPVKETNIKEGLKR